MLFLKMIDTPPYINLSFLVYLLLFECYNVNIKLKGFIKGEILMNKNDEVVELAIQIVIAYYEKTNNEDA